MPDTEKLLTEIKSLRKTVQLQKKVIEIEIDKNKQVLKPNNDLSWYQNEISQLRQELSEEKARKHEQHLSLEGLIQSLLQRLPSLENASPTKDIISGNVTSGTKEYSEFEEVIEEDIPPDSNQPSEKESPNPTKAPSHCHTCGVTLDGEASCFSCGSIINH